MILNSLFPALGSLMHGVSLTVNMALPGAQGNENENENENEDLRGDQREFAPRSGLRKAVPSRQRSRWALCAQPFSEACDY